MSGSGAKHFCWSMGVRLQTCVSHLEEWVSSVGLEAQYLRVSERLLSLVDLLATSRHTLLRVRSLSIFLLLLFKQPLSCQHFSRNTTGITQTVTG